MKAKIVRVVGNLVAYVPLGVFVGFNWQDYISTEGSSWSLGIGGVILAIVLVLRATDSAKKVFGSGYVVLATIFVLSMLMKPLIEDLAEITGLLLGGETVNKYIFGPIANKMEVKQTNVSQAQVIAEAIKWSSNGNV